MAETSDQGRAEGAKEPMVRLPSTLRLMLRTLDFTLSIQESDW